MEQNDYKQEIIDTRVGCLGSSDARMLAQIASIGCVPQSAHKRLAVCKGLIPATEIPRTAAINAGDKIEMAIYEHISANDARYESNPMWVSEKLSQRNVKLISHPDIVLKDEKKRVVNVYEVKTTKNTIEETQSTYKSQMYIHYLLGKEVAAQMGKNWAVRVFLVHYNTDGLDLESCGGNIDFDPQRMTVKSMRFPVPMFDVKYAMTLVDVFLEQMTDYYEGEEIDGAYLPEKVRGEIDAVAQVLMEIKEREQRVEEFKARLYAFMKDKDIKSIKTDVWGITRVDESEARSFDSKRYIDEFTAKHPRVAKRLMKEYTKVTKRKGSVMIKLKTK